jgi:hypothetical protein
MEETPTPAEIDAVGHFVEAARELRSSPFFVEEYRSLSISMRQGDPKEKIRGRFPDPNVIRSVLVPFRRLWHQNEPCQYAKVTKILKRYVPDFRGFLDSLALDGSHSAVRQMPWLKNISLSFTDVIDVWLNTRYHHVGKSTRLGRFTREDFDRFSEGLGPVLFEFYFLSAVQEAGIACFNILQCAESFLRGFAKKGLTPSFALDPGPSEANVERRTPGFTPAEDSPQQRVWRLRRRRHYDGINEFLSITSTTDSTVARFLPESTSFDEFADRCGVLLQQTEDIGTVDKEDCTNFGGCIDNHPTAIRNRKSRRGFVARRRDGTLLWGEDYVPVLRDQYIEFRTAFLREPFV